MKRLIQWLLFPLAVVTGGEWVVKPNTMRFRFLTWLYGDSEPLSDGWLYPNDDDHEQTDGR